MRETTKPELKSALYGVLRLIAGYQDWKLVEHLPTDEYLPTLLAHTSQQVSDLSADLNADPKAVNQVMRKLKAYQQLSLVDNFCFNEVEWD